MPALIGRTRLPRIALLAALALLGGVLLAACGDDGPANSPPLFTLEGPPEGTAAPIGTLTATATVTATVSPRDTSPGGPAEAAGPSDPGPIVGVPVFESIVLERPVEVAAYPIGDYEIALAEQGGILYGVNSLGADVILDLSDRTIFTGDERGLLSFALAPTFEATREIWMYYSAVSPERTVLSRFSADDDGLIDPDTELIALQIEQPYANHNGGAVRFGPDGALYLSIGDGGAGGDPHGHSQNTRTLLGTVIRLDVSAATAEVPYTVPADNPFIDDPDILNEIWAYGLRNPWRMSFDPLSGELWSGDVGQNRWEEINILQSGGNYGWAILEGPECFQAQSCDREAMTPPVAYYANAGGRCSVSGGVVARGVSASNIEGAYLYGDLCSGEIWALSADAAEFGPEGAEPVIVGSGFGTIVSMAQVGDEIYVVTFGQELQRLVNE